MTIVIQEERRGDSCVVAVAAAVGTFCETDVDGDEKMPMKTMEWKKCGSKEVLKSNDNDSRTRARLKSSHMYHI